MKITPTTVALKTLVLSPLNVRTCVKDATEIDSLAASIAANGLLQPIAVHAMPRKKFGVIAGGRRLRALEQIGFKGEIPAVLLEGTDEELIEASLTENYVRQAMRPYEIYAAFKAMGLPPEKLATNFGLEQARAKRILRLANLAPEVFEAYSLGQFDDAVAQAFAATEDHDLQRAALTAFNQQSQWNRDAMTVRKLLGFGDHNAEQMLRKVGREAYEAAGGRLEVDLFTDKVKVLDQELLSKLRIEQQEAQRQAIIDQHTDDEVTWTDAYPGGQEHSAEAYRRRIRPIQRELTEEENAREQDLREQLTQIEGDLECECEPHVEDELETKAAEIEAQLAVLHDGLFTLPPGPKLGVIALNYSGDYEATFFTLDTENGETVPKLGEKEKPELTQKADAFLTYARHDMLRKEIYRHADYPGRWRTDLYLYTMALKQGLTSVPFEEFVASTEAFKDETAAALFAGLIGGHTTKATKLAVEHIGHHADSHPRELWTPTAEFFDLFRKTQLLQFAEEIAGRPMEGLTQAKLGYIKDTLLAISLGECKTVGDDVNENGKRWVPKWLRFQTEDARASLDEGEEAGEREEYDGAVTDPGDSESSRAMAAHYAEEAEHEPAE